MLDQPSPTPARSSVGSALLRAMHVDSDPPPHIFVDELGLRLTAHERPVRLPPGMSEETAGRLRTSIVLRARYIEDLVTEQVQLGIRQYVSSRIFALLKRARSTAHVITMTQSSQRGYTFAASAASAPLMPPTPCRRTGNALDAGLSCEKAPRTTLADSSAGKWGGTPSRSHHGRKWSYA